MRERGAVKSRGRQAKRAQWRDSEHGPGAHHRSLSPGSGPAAALLARRRSARHGDSKPSESRCWVGPRSGAEPNVNGRHVGEGLGGSSFAGRPIESHHIRNRVKGCISATEDGRGRCHSGTLVRPRNLRSKRLGPLERHQPVSGLGSIARRASTRLAADQIQRSRSPSVPICADQGSNLDYSTDEHSLIRSVGLKEPRSPPSPVFPFNTNSSSA
jgi:hypothetical protein